MLKVSLVVLAVAIATAGVFGTPISCSMGQFISSGSCVNCPAGTFSSTRNAVSCQNHKTCGKGQFVQKAPTATSDRLCFSCYSGKFSDTVNAASCTPFTICPAGVKQIKRPTPSSDRVCEFPNSCAALKARTPSITSGVYTLSIAGVNSGSPFSVYCDFVIDGGIGYAVVFNRYFSGYQAGPSTTEMTQTVNSGSAGYQNDYRISPGNIFSLYSGGGASRMIVYATIGHSSIGGISSGSTYRSVRFSMTPSQMANCWNGNSNEPFQAGISWVASPGGQTGSDANMLNEHNIRGGFATSGGVHQWSQGYSNVNQNVLFEYSPNGGWDPNHFWMVGDGTVSSSYFGAYTLYGANGANNGPLYSRYGGIAIY